MRLATWNINSIRSRADRALAFLERTGTDVLALQETKCKDEQFPREAFEAAGYEVACVDSTFTERRLPTRVLAPPHTPPARHPLPY